MHWPSAQSKPKPYPGQAHLPYQHARLVACIVESIGHVAAAAPDLPGGVRAGMDSCTLSAIMRSR